MEINYNEQIERANDHYLWQTSQIEELRDQCKKGFDFFYARNLINLDNSIRLSKIYLSAGDVRTALSFITENASKYVNWMNHGKEDLSNNSYFRYLNSSEKGRKQWELDKRKYKTNQKRVFKLLNQIKDLC